MKKFLIPLAIVAASILMLGLCALYSVTVLAVALAPHVRSEMHQKDLKLQEVRERLAAATIYKETAEQRLNRGDNEGVFRAKDEYDARLREIDARYASTTRR